MILEIYCIKDTVVGQFLNPYLQHNQQHAIRSARMAVNASESNPLRENAKDKQLWKLGTFNDATGEIKSSPEFIANINDLIEYKKETKNEILHSNEPTTNNSNA